MSKSTTYNCFVADDHPAVLEAVCLYLEGNGVTIVGRAETGTDALELISELKPQVALLDVRMPELGGIEIARQTARKSPDTAIILYTGYGDRALLTEAMDAGARGFVLKEAPLDDLAAGSPARRGRRHVRRPRAGGRARGAAGGQAARADPAGTRGPALAC